MSSFKLYWTLHKSERSAAFCAHRSYTLLERPVGDEEGTMGGPTTQGRGVRQRRCGLMLRGGISVEDSPKPCCGTEVARSPCMAT